MRAGYAWRDITPAPGLTLSGFAARCNRPSTGVADPLSVHALAVEQDGTTILLLVYDLLALGPEITALLQARLDGLALGIPAACRILCCTHTHSAPATITLLGCGETDAGYWRQLAEVTAAVAKDACSRLQPATLQLTTARLPGANYNRRRVLSDGRVVMAQVPGTTVLRSGPVNDTMHLLRFVDTQGRGVVALAHWAAHPCTVCSPMVSADYPGELRRRLTQAHGLPFIFLQGACGNLNPPFRSMNRQEMLQNVDGIMAQLVGVTWPAGAVATAPMHSSSQRVSLPYAPAPDAAWLRKFADDMTELNVTGRGSAETTAMLANVLNVEPGKEGDPALMRYLAGILATWAQRVLAGLDAGLPAAADLVVHAWQLGDIIWCFIAAEVFAETAITLQAAFPGKTVLLVGYASPLVGYLPTDEAMADGGYEVNFAYRCYAHPAPFRPGAEPAAVAALVRELRR